MNFHNNDNSIVNSCSNKNVYYSNDSYEYESSNSILKILHTIFDGLNFSIIFLVLVISFLSFDSQNKWTIFYSMLDETKYVNDSLIDYISKTEELFLKQLDLRDDYKRTTSKDLIYLGKPLKKSNNNFLNSHFKIISTGLKDSFYQRGY